MTGQSKPGLYAGKKAAGSKNTKPLEGLWKSAKADPSVLSPAALMALGLAGVAVAAVPDKTQNAPPVPKNDAALAGATGLSDRVAKESSAPVASPNASDVQLQLADLIDDLQAQTVLEAAAPGLPTVPSELASQAEAIALQQPYQADLFAQLGDGAAVVSVVAEPVLLAQASVPAAVPQAAAATAAPADGAAAGAAGAASILPAVLVLGALGVAAAVSGGSSSSANAIVPDTIAPVMKSMVANGVAKTITLTFSETIDAANLPDISKFTVSTGGVANTVSSISATGAVVTLTLTNVFADGTRVDLSYTDPTSGNDAKAIQDAAGNDALGFTNLPVADGYVRGASVYADANNNGKADAGELLGTTDAGGNFFLPAGTKGAIIAVGGVNIDTGVANTIELKAPEGSTTVNPLTTLVQAVVQANGGAVTTATIATAMATVATSLGLAGTDLLKFDPISAFKDAAANPATKAAAEAVAVAAQKAATQVATIVALAEKAAPGAGATVVSNLATVVKTAATSGTPAVNLSASTTIDSMIGTALDKVSSADKTAARSSIDIAATAISTATDLTTLSAAQGQALDKTAPAAPTSIVVASISNDATPTVRVNIDTSSLLGKAANVGDVVTLNEGSALKATTTLTAADIAAGYKTVDVANASALADGDHSLTALITDRAGNVGAASAAVVVKIDTIAPVAPVVSAVSTDNLVSAVEKAAGVAVSGSAEAGATVAVTWGATVKAVTATTGGTWSTSFSSAEVPADASTTISAVATDAAGNAGVAGTRGVTVDTTAPTISGSSPADNGLSLGLASNLVMSSAEALAKGTGSLSLYKSGNVLVEAIDVTGSRVTLSEDKKSISIDPTADLVKDETYYVKASAGAFTDTAGNPWAGISNATDWNFTGAGATVLVNTVATDNKINLSESGSAITVTGTLGAEAAVLAAYKVADMTAVLGPANGTDITLTNLSYTYTSGATGAWSAVLPASAVSGTAAYTLLVSFKGTVGAALNINGDATQAVQVDTVLPTSPVLALGTGVSNGATSAEAVQSGGVVTVNAESGATTVVNFTRGSATVTKTLTGTGAAQAVTLVSGDLTTLGEGVVAVSAVATDGAGNVSTAGSASFTLDTLAPTISGSSPADNGLSLGLASNLVMSSAEALAKGTGSLSLYKSGDVLVEAIDVSGSRVTLSSDKKSISIDPTADLVKDETYYVKASAGAFTDTAGNPWAGISNATDWNFTGAGATVLVNAVSTDNKINLSESGSPITVNGTLGAEAAVLAAYKVADMTAVLRPASGTDIALTNLSYTYTSGATGAWSAVLPASAVSGTAAYTLLVSFKGTVGAALNINGDGTQVVQVDTVVVAPSLALTTDSGSSTSDKLTNNAALTPSGETGATFEYSANGTSSWSSAAPSPSTGANTVYARQTDSAGNVSGASSAFTFNYDASGPTVSTVAISSATGIQASTLNAGDVVSVTVTLSEATTVVTSGGTPQLALNIGGTTVQAAYASGSGTTALVFNYTVLAGQTDANGISIAANSLALNGGTLLDAAGNAATLTHALVADNASYMVDTTAPTVTLVGPTSFTASGGTFTFNFSEAVTGFNAADIVLVGGTAATVAGSGASYTSVISPTASTTPLAFSLNVPAAAATDAAGNASTAATAFTRSILVGTSANETLTVNDLLNNIFLNAGGDDTVKLSAATGSTVAATDVVSGFSTGDKIDLSAILGSGAGYTALYSSPFFTIENGSLINSGKTVKFSVVLNSESYNSERIEGLSINLGYDYSNVSSMSVKSAVVKNADGTTNFLTDATDSSTTVATFAPILLSKTTGVIQAPQNFIDFDANSLSQSTTHLTNSGKALDVTLTLTNAVTSFAIVFDSDFSAVNAVQPPQKTVPVSGQSSTISTNGAVSAARNLQLEIVSDTTALGTVGDNQLRMLVAAYDTANGLTHLTVQYDTNSAYGTGKTTASSVIAIDFVGDVTALLTPASLTFI